jgi:hypothetical protein
MPDDVQNGIHWLPTHRGVNFEFEYVDEFDAVFKMALEYYITLSRILRVVYFLSLFFTHKLVYYRVFLCGKKTVPSLRADPQPWAGKKK